jgi:filamentous hemagglutinin family protein
VYNITGGTRPGNGPNLFHSFDHFSVGTGDIASFNGPSGITNILSRVTGGVPSDIYGTLRSTIDGANLFLLNPSGVMFGSNAKLEVSGSFHVSTADFIRFADDTKFFANLAKDRMLTVAPPAAFGFLGENLTGITIQGSALQVPTGQTLSVVGGDMTVVGGSLLAPSGRIHLASVASAGEVVFNTPEQAPNLSVDTFAHLGEIRFSNATLLDTSGRSGGTVVIRGGRFMLDNSDIRAATLGNVDGARVGIDMNIAGDMVMRQGRVLAGTAGKGDAGAITLNVDRLTLFEGAQIISGTSSAGRGGTLTVSAIKEINITGRDSKENPSGLFGITIGSGNASSLNISTPILTLSGGRILAGTTGEGTAGAITMNVDRLTLTDRAQIDSSSTRTATKAAGSITIQGLDGAGTAASVVALTNSQLLTRAEGQGAGGNIGIHATEVTLADGATISATAAGLGNAGSITITEAATVRSVDSSLTTEAQGGAGGVISIDATRLIDLTKTNISATVLGGNKAGGNITLIAPTVEMAGGTLQAITHGKERGGNIVVAVGTLILTQGAQIATDTFGSGQGGMVTVTAADTVTISGQDPNGQASRIASGTEGRGDGGGVTIRASTLRLEEGGVIAATAGAAAAGNAGNVVIAADQVSLTGGAQIATGTAGQGNAGMVTIRGREGTDSAAAMVRIVGQDPNGQASRIVSGTEGRGDGGEVTIITSTLRLEEGGVIAAAAGTVAEGNAGAVIIAADQVSLTGGAQITTGTAGQGNAGMVTIRGLRGADTLADMVVISGQSSGFFTTATGSGQGGDIILQARNIHLAEGAVISAQSTGAANAGSIRITATDTFRSEHSTVTTEATEADGGDIQVTVPGMIRLRNSKITATVGGGPKTEGGNITIDSGFLILENSQIITEATLRGRGGNIIIVAEKAFLADSLSLVDASSQLGIDGKVDIRTPIADPSGSVTPLPQTFLPVVLPLRCAERLQGGQISSVVVSGRDSVPATPSSVLPSPFYQTRQGDHSLVNQKALPRDRNLSRLHLLRPEDKRLPTVEVQNAQQFAQAVWDPDCFKGLAEKNALHKKSR